MSVFMFLFQQPFTSMIAFKPVEMFVTVESKCVDVDVGGCSTSPLAWINLDFACCKYTVPFKVVIEKGFDVIRQGALVLRLPN